ncbi:MULTISPECIES: DUF6691 family protein [Phaeobacter]|uniref:DUF6691 family protein n=1 Tax=Phaeobacter TaxID=302485 RepID=UPI000160CEAE|nr:MULTISPECIES: DUF6691 family protein [Phaeobacter]AFO87279.1 hypothetical protein PGA2_c12720 [Phaeobacter inhibens 2.10]AXT42083.1 hypothetical protein D1821_06585 [Phaeobacter inhibens]MBQ4806618.1 hypothetical protein [Phaeobacter sp. HS012]MBQ4881468.1 hypothetical protein [Phaeobacter sp. HS011]UWR61979.1 hypothetical protein K4F88_06460 [Phaeobacter inhibens]
MRLLLSFSAGGLFGLGLFLSGMTDTQKVQGWLDIFGAWDPTLAFVMGGAILPMALAWQLTQGRAPLVGGHFPTPPRQELDRRLIIGSVLFGIGWGLAGLCPGPAIASLSYGGTGGIIFIAAMLVGMIAAPPVALRLDRAAAST